MLRAPEEISFDPSGSSGSSGGVTFTCSDSLTSSKLSCDHDSIDPVRCVCRSCGVVVDSTYRYDCNKPSDYDERRLLQRGSQKKSTLFTAHERETLGFSQNVYDRAEEISLKMASAPKNNRMNRLKMRKFVCLYYAHVELKIDVAPVRIARKLDLSDRRISNALTDFCPISTGYEPPKMTQEKYDHAAVRIAASFAKSFGLTQDAIEEIKEMIITALNTNTKIAKRYARTIASGAIMAYVQTNGLDLSAEDISRETHVSKTTIISTCKEIQEAYNSI